MASGKRIGSTPIVKDSRTSTVRRSRMLRVGASNEACCICDGAVTWPKDQTPIRVIANNQMLSFHVECFDELEPDDFQKLMERK